MKNLLKFGFTKMTLIDISFKSNLNLSLKRTLRYFDKDEVFGELENMIYHYQCLDILDDPVFDYRIKSVDSCHRKYEKNLNGMSIYKTFNDVLGFRILVDNYDEILSIDDEDFRIVDMRGGKVKDDGYCGVHIYFQLDNYHYPIEIQANTYYDRQFNNWLHKYVYKKGCKDKLGLELRKLYEDGKITQENEFVEVLNNVLFSK